MWYILYTWAPTSKGLCEYVYIYMYIYIYVNIVCILKPHSIDYIPAWTHKYILYAYMDPLGLFILLRDCCTSNPRELRQVCTKVVQELCTLAPRTKVTLRAVQSFYRL